MKKRWRLKEPPVRPESVALLEATDRDSDFMLEGYRLLLEETDNPYQAWMAIDLCIKNKTEFPDWLFAYLTRCAERMKSEKAKETGDVRKILPWIFGFHNKGGPGNFLNPDADRHKKLFALNFAVRLEQGDDAPTARSNAFNDTFDGGINIDDRTLQRWLLEVFDLKSQPSTTEEWKNIAVGHFHELQSIVRAWAAHKGLPL